MARFPTFMYGPKDGAPVPEPLWALDEIELQERTKDSVIIHLYKLNYDDKSYYYQGAYPDEEENNG